MLKLYLMFLVLFAIIWAYFVIPHFYTLSIFNYRLSNQIEYITAYVNFQNKCMCNCFIAIAKCMCLE